MSTCNFGLPVLSKNYTIGLNAQDDFDFDCELENVRYELEQLKGYEDLKEIKTIRDIGALLKKYNIDYHL